MSATPGVSIPKARQERAACHAIVARAGALAARLLATGVFRTECDSAHASMDLWSLAEGDLPAYIEKAAQRHRLKRLGLDDVIPYSFECDRVDVVPLFDGKLIKGVTSRRTGRAS